jgi:hypothetical protein
MKSDHTDRTRHRFDQARALAALSSDGRELCPFMAVES